VNARWVVPVGHPLLHHGEIHVWRASAIAWDAEQATLLALLNEDERARAGDFYFARDRRQFVVAHGALRRILAGYARHQPDALRFGTGPFGKPHLVFPDGGSQLQFNLSHSGDIVLVAVTLGINVGVDVEQWSDAFDPVEVAEHFFSARECAELRSLRGPDQLTGFFACWSRKEAYIKATGVGVSHGLDYFDVTVAAGSVPRILADRRQAKGGKAWRLFDLELEPGCNGAVVADGGEVTAHYICRPSRSVSDPPP
jgi:4'-phosphopantetheinyl transferase